MNLNPSGVNVREGEAKEDIHNPNLLSRMKLDWKPLTVKKCVSCDVVQLEVSEVANCPFTSAARGDGSAANCSTHVCQQAANVNDREFKQLIHDSRLASDSESKEGIHN